MSLALVETTTMSIPNSSSQKLRTGIRRIAFEELLVSNLASILFFHVTHGFERDLFEIVLSHDTDFLPFSIEILKAYSIMPMISN